MPLPMPGWTVGDNSYTDMEPFASALDELYSWTTSLESGVNGLYGTAFGTEDAYFKASAQYDSTYKLNDFDYVDMYFTIQGYDVPCIRICPNKTANLKYGFETGYVNTSDNGIRMFICTFTIDDNAVDSFKLYMSNTAPTGSSIAMWSDVSSSDLLRIKKFIGYGYEENVGG